MKKKLPTIIIILIFLIGLSITLYPTAADFYNKKVGSYAVKNYKKEVETKNDDYINEILRKADEYNKELLNKETKFVNGEVKDQNYLSQLKVSDQSDIMGEIEIEKIKVKLPIYHGTSQPVLQAGVGHIEGTALPVGGKGNHSVLSGHTGLPSAKLFTGLDKLKQGDKFKITVLNRVLYYKVDNIAVVKPNETELLNPIENEDLVTLVTCTPYGVNSHRLLVRGKRTVGDEPTNNKDTNKEVQNNKLTTEDIEIIILLGIGIVTISVVVYGKIKNRDY